MAGVHSAAAIPTSRLSAHAAAAAVCERVSGLKSTEDIRALVLDDDAFSLELARQALLAIGVMHVECVDNASDAESALTAETPCNLLLCDLMMPDVDGVLFLRWLAGQNKDIAVILCTGSDARVRHAAEQLALEYRLTLLGSLPKPISAESLAGALALDAEAPMAPPDHRESAALSLAETNEIIAHGLCLNYQPQIRVADRGVDGFEALLRFREASVPASPFEFVNRAESEGLIDRLTGSVFDLALNDLSDWQAQGYVPRISLNISAANLRNLGLPEQFLQALVSRGLKPENITLELTETAVVEDLARSLDILTRIRLKGFELSLDDFGTGYASMEKLSSMPFTELKIDRSFIFGSRRSEDMRKILAASVKLAKDLGLRVVAEGVESPEDFRMVERLGCDLVQGFLFSRARPAREIPDLLRHWETPHTLS